MTAENAPVTIVNTRYLKDDVNSYSEDVIRLAKDIDANLILVSFTGTSGEERERWNRKLIRPFVQKAHDEGLKVSFYMKLTNLMWKTMFHERPESKDWIMVYPDGSPALYQGFPFRYMGCLNNPSWLQHLKDMIKSAIDYDPDALFYDNCFIPRELRGSRDDESAAGGWACYCDSCRERFKSYTREVLGWECALPAKPDWHDPMWQTFISFRDKTFADAVGMVVEHAHELKPDIVVYPNVTPPWVGAGGAKGSATNLIADKVDLLLFERRGAPRLDTPPAGGMPRAINAAVDWKYGWRLRDTPIWYRMNKPGSYTTDQMKIGLGEASAFNGATHHIMAAGLAREHEKAQAIRRHYGFLQENEHFYTDVEPVADVAIHVSMPTINWYHPDRVAQGAEDLPMNIQGIAQALVELHIPFNVVLDDDLARDHGYRVLVLPNVASMSDEQVDAVASFVERGGSLVATNVTSLYDEKYRTRSDYALADVFGAHHGQELEGLVTNQYGKGLSAYLPGSPDEDFWRDGLSSTLHLFKEAMSYALRDDWQVRIDAPTTVVTNVTEKRDTSTTLIHLINFEVQQTESHTAFTGPAIQPVTSTIARRVVDIPVRLRRPKGKSLKQVILYSTDLDDSINLEARVEEKHVSFTIPVLKIYDLVVVDWE